VQAERGGGMKEKEEQRGWEEDEEKVKEAGRRAKESSAPSVTATKGNREEKKNSFPQYKTTGHRT